jgi:hypothetical protein
VSTPAGAVKMAARASAQADLRAVWDEMLVELGRARDAIDNPRLYPPPPTDRNLAEGYRYLLGFVYGSYERAFAEDPNFPYFRRSMQPLNRATIDNADALYLTAPIDGNATYLVTGKAQNHRHWRGEARASSGRLAPHFAVFEAMSWYTGDSGSIRELNPVCCGKWVRWTLDTWWSRRTGPSGYWWGPNALTAIPGTSS